jgi:prepilin peptidase CpaA
VAGKNGHANGIRADQKGWSSGALPEASSFGPAALVWVVRAGVLVLLVVICWSDWRARRIPNSLVFAGLLSALAWHGIAAPGSGLFGSSDAGALGLLAASSGALAAFAGFLLLHWMRVMGAGDVKLMTMLGAVFGMHLLPLLVLLVFLAGAVLVAARLLDGGRRRATMANLRRLFCGVRATFDSGPRLRFDPRADTADRLPFGLAIAAGATTLALMQLSGAIT